MESLNLTGNVQNFLGIYLILHGLIHSLFLSYSKNDYGDSYTGWSGKSWILDSFLDADIVNLIGKTIWIIIIILFVLSGLAILKVPVLKDYAELLIIIASVLALIALAVFFNGLHPTPYNFLIGIAIDIILLLFVLFYPNEQNIVVLSLGLLFILGVIVVFISDVIPLMVNSIKS